MTNEMVETTPVTSIINYLIPEIMIITFIMLNQIQLRLIGLYDRIEEDFEGVNDGIQRYMSQGDIEKVKADKITSTFMDMSKYFYSFHE